MATLKLYFLGKLDLYTDDRQLPKPPTLKSQSLLAYLVLHRDQPQPRGRLVGLFWGEQSERKARRSLSTALWHIRRCLPDPSVILNDTYTIQFDPQCNLWLDTDEFEVQVARGNVTGFRSAIALYRGDFLDGFTDDWIISERYRFDALCLQTLSWMMMQHEAAGEYRDALATALRLLLRDPSCEDAHRLAMRSYCYLGQRSAALEQYKRCQEIVLQELGIEPMVETTQLYQDILEGRLEIGSYPDVFDIEMPSHNPAGRSPFDVLLPVRLVGREHELSFLESFWQQSRAGCGGLALISGEAGVGKTCLVDEFTKHLRWQGVRVLWGRCYEFERALPYQPFAEAVDAMVLTLTDDELARVPAWALFEAARLAPVILQRNLTITAKTKINQEELNLLRIDLPNASGWDQEQARLFDGLTELITALSLHSPVLVVLEDLHWASQSTLVLLHHLARHMVNHSVMIVGTYRPEATPDDHLLLSLRRQLAREGHAQILHLTRLSREAVEEMIMDMSGAGESLRPLAARLHRETEGNPFFLIETIKALFETNVIRLEEGIWRGELDRISEAAIPLPASMSDAILARAQRLEEPAQDLLQLATVLGREFNFDLLDLAWGKGEDSTLEALDHLLRQRMIEECVDPTGSDFTFTHHKIQEVIYQSLPRHLRLHLHARVGTAMEKLYHDELEGAAGKLSYHFEQACRLDKALTSKAANYLLLAGQQAVRQFANQEAVDYYRRGLDILHLLPEKEKRMQQEVELQIALATPTALSQGYASPELKRIYERAHDLCRELGETPQLFTSLVGLTRYYGLTGNFELAIELEEQMLAIAQSAKDNDLLLEAYRQMAGHLFGVGQLEEAQQAQERVVALYRLSQHESHAYRFGHDPMVSCLGFLSMTLWLQGYPEQAQDKCKDLLQIMQSMVHPSSLAYGHCLLAKQACMRRDANAVCEHADAAIHLGHLYGLPSWTSLANALKGWALFEQGELEGMEILEQGINGWQSRGFAHFTPFLLSLQVEIFLKRRKLDQGMRVAAAGVAMGQRGGDQYWSAELYRLQGALVKAKSRDGSRAEAHFQQAIKIASQQGARMLELRAAISLASLRREQGQPGVAKQVLEAIYNRFTEGFETGDLKAASTLLLELGQPPGAFLTGVC